ncbi:MAG: hypothetical protein WBR15_11820 [Gammaproteobacteria bacterium]
MTHKHADSHGRTRLRLVSTLLDVRKLFTREETAVRPVLLHSHFFKNAGTSIDWALRRSFGRGFVNHRRNQKMRQGGMGYVEQYLTHRRRTVAVSSHHMPFNPDFTSPKLQYWRIMMLRRPLERAFSVYCYEKVQPPAVSLGAKMVRQLDMRGYFEWRMSPQSPAVIRSFHTRYLCGIRNFKHGVGDREVANAVAHSRLPQVLVGFVERFDESMVLFESVLRDPFQGVDFSYVRQNYSRRRVEDVAAYLRAELGAELFAELMHHNRADEQLYAAVEQDFEARLAAIPDFHSRLNAFRARCANLDS